MVNKYKNTPLLNGVIFFVLTVGSPITIYFLMTKWSDSIARQVVGLSLVVGGFIFASVKNKKNILTLLVLFFSQFSVSFMSFELTPPVTFPILLFDLILIMLVFAFMELPEKISFDKLSTILILLVVWQLIVLFYSVHFSKSIVFLMWTVKYLSLYIVLSNLKYNDKLFEQVVIILATVLIIQSLIVCVQYILKSDIGLVVLGERDSERSRQFFVNGNMRASGTLGATNALGGYIAMLMVFLVPYVLANRGWFYHLAFFMGAISLVIPLSRAAWLSFGVCSIILIINLIRSKSIKFGRVLFMGIFALVILLAVIYYNQTQILSRFEDRAAMASAQGRIDQIPSALKVVSKRPLFGIGPGVSSFFGAWNDHLKYVKNELPGINLGNQVHNSILQYLIESGYAGGGIFCLLIITVILSAFKRHAHSDPHIIFKYACSSAALTYLLDSQFGTEINNYQMMVLFISFLALSNNKYIKFNNK